MKNRSQRAKGAPPPAPDTTSSRLVGVLDLPRDNRGYLHPQSEDEVVAIVRRARAEGLSVRVRGSAHSVPAAIHSDARLSGTGKRAVELVLDRLTALAFDERRRRVTVQAGRRFGLDPRDPTRRSTAESGLCFQLDLRGWALPNLGGVTHTTVAGFLATGAAGGSVMHGLHDSVVGVRLVDGTGELREIWREQEPELFGAVGVSLGLLGVITAVTFECVPRFDVIGSEAVTGIGECGFDAFADGAEGLEGFLRKAPYARVLWWPQRGVDKVAVWQARRMEPADFDDETGPPWALRRRPYRAFDPILGSTVPLQAAAGAALAALGGARAAVERLAGPRLGPMAVKLAERVGLPRVKAALINAFVPEDRAGPRRFWDSWWRGLPMDDEIDESLLPTAFTEIWVPLASAGEAMRRLREVFQREPAAAGSFVLELYAAGACPFWLSPGHERDSLRVNVFWLTRNPGDPRDEHFPRFWEALAGLGARLHWGKILPHDARGAAAETGPRYPRWGDFMRVRAEMDPDGVFLTAYWRAHLGLDGGEARPVAPLPRARPFDEPATSGRKWPVVFPFQPADASLLASAEQMIEGRGYVPATPEEVCRVFWLDPTAEWLVEYAGIEWLTEYGVPDDSIVDMSFSFMTIRIRVVEMQLPHRWVTQILACSLPLATRMVEEVVLATAPDGGTDVRWRIAYDVPPGMGPLNVLVKPLFHRLFQGSIDGLGRYLGKAARRKAPAGSERLFQAGGAS